MIVPYIMHVCMYIIINMMTLLPFEREIKQIKENKQKISIKIKSSKVVITYKERKEKLNLTH